MSKSFLEGKNILLLYARFFGYDKKVKEKLESLGANVFLFDARANINSFEKAIKKITRFFYVKKQRRFHKRIALSLKDNQIDYIFSNEYLDSMVLNLYKSYFPNAKLILYMDDSVNNFCGIENTFSLYDRVLTFDRADSEKYSLLFRPLFYCDCFKADASFPIRFDVSFVGTCHSDRVKVLDSIKEKQPNILMYFYCFLPSRFMFNYYKAKEKSFKNKKKSDFKYESLSLEETARIMKESKAVLDIQHPKQSGLTMRSIEAFGCQKKILTTNKDIVNYDFYDSRNVCIIDRADPVIDSSFLKSSYCASDKSIYHKYSLLGWIKDVFTF